MCVICSELHSLAHFVAVDNYFHMAMIRILQHGIKTDKPVLLS